LVLGCGLCLSQSGCLFYTYKPAKLSILDAETGEPISGAKINTVYVYDLALNPPNPRAVDALADANGSAVMTVATLDCMLWHFNADGYLPLERWGSMAGQTNVVRLYKMPAPSLTIIVPDGYRGPLTVDLRPSTSWVQGQVGQRDFAFEASSTGSVSIDASPLLLRKHYWWFDSLNATYKSSHRAGFPVLREEGPPDEISFRYVDGTRRLLFVVGTQQDLNELRRKIGATDDDLSAVHNPDQKLFNSLFDQPPPEDDGPLEPTSAYSE
jgi:hypothetical protein